MTVAAATAALALSLLSPTAPARAAEAPALTGPIPSTSRVGDPAHGYPFLATDVNLRAAGYVEEEFFLAGEATRYAPDGAVISEGHAFTTRVVVRRPVSPQRKNGTLIAEWYNVSNQWDQEVDWFQTHEHLIRNGYTWVGISAQRAGVHSATGLKAWSPQRYDALDLTDGGTILDDSLSYDVFTQGVGAIRQKLRPRWVIATGHSQSAGRLATYYNNVQSRAGVVDAVVLHGGGGVLRTDLSTKVFRINSEGDVASGILSAAARAQPDSAVLRSWEVAGASHGDWKLITDYGPLRKRDIGSYPGGYPGEPQTCALPSLSRIPQHMVQNAVYDHTVAWLGRGIAPPSAPKIETEGTQVVRDELGLARGGIRLAQHAVPLRINSGSNTGPGFCFLDGSSVPLTDAQLAALHPSVLRYATEVARVTRTNAPFLPRDNDRDPAWFTDISDLITEYESAGRIAPAVATSLRSHVAAAQRSTNPGALTHLALLTAQAQRIPDRPVRDAVTRVGTALIAVLTT